MHRLGQKRPAVAHELRALDLGVGCHGPELQRAVVDADLTKLGHAMKRDQPVGLHEAEPDHSDQRRAARDEACLAVELLERGDRVADRFGLDETERMETHGYFAPATARTASMILV